MLNIGIYSYRNWVDLLIDRRLLVSIGEIILYLGKVRSILIIQFSVGGKYQAMVLVTCELMGKNSYLVS